MTTCTSAQSRPARSLGHFHSSKHPTLTTEDIRKGDCWVPWHQRVQKVADATREPLKTRAVYLREDKDSGVRSTISRNVIWDQSSRGQTETKTDSGSTKRRTCLTLTLDIKGHGTPPGIVSFLFSVASDHFTSKWTQCLWQGTQLSTTQLYSQSVTSKMFKRGQVGGGNQHVTENSESLTIYGSCPVSFF